MTVLCCSYAYFIFKLLVLFLAGGLIYIVLRYIFKMNHWRWFVYVVDEFDWLMVNIDVHVGSGRDIPQSTMEFINLALLIVTYAYVQLQSLIVPLVTSSLVLSHYKYQSRCSCLWEYLGRCTSFSRFIFGFVRLQTSKAHSWTCMDIYVFATPYRVTWDFYFTARNHTLKIREWSEGELNYVSLMTRLWLCTRWSSKKEMGSLL